MKCSQISSTIRWLNDEAQQLGDCITLNILKLLNYVFKTFNFICVLYCNVAIIKKNQWPSGYVNS